LLKNAIYYLKSLLFPYYSYHDLANFEAYSLLVEQYYIFMLVVVSTGPAAVRRRVRACQERETVAGSALTGSNLADVG
jgi:hypothetical protein